MPSQLNTPFKPNKISRHHVHILLNSQIHTILNILLTELRLLNHIEIGYVIHSQGHNRLLLGRLFHLLIKLSPLITLIEVRLEVR